MRSIASSMSAAETSRWVTARRTPAASRTRAGRRRRGGARPRRRRRARAQRRRPARSSSPPARGRPAFRRVGEPLGEPARVRVVVGEALDVVVERVEPRRGDDAGLAHRAAEEVLEPPRLRHPRRDPAINAPTGQPRPFERQRLTVSNSCAVLGCGNAGGDDGVEEPRPVEVRRQPARARLRRHLPHLPQRPDAPAAAVVRVLDADERVGATCRSPRSLTASPSSRR